MPSTYTLNNGIELIGTGEQSGTWGDTTNTNLELLDTALDGQVSVTLAATGSSGSPNTLPISDGASSNGRNRLVIFGDGGDLGGTAFVQLTPNDAEKIIYVRNNLSGSRSILLFQGTYSASNDYEVPAGTTAVVFFNGAGTGAVAANVFNNAFFDSLRLGSVSVDKILDEDNMASNDAAALATQQSIKAYVDSQVGTVDTLAEILANGNTSGGTNIQMTTTDELQFRDTALTISSSADGQLDIDADTEIEIVAPTVDIDASTAMTIDTAALTVTGAVDLNTSLNVDGTVTSDGVTVAGNLSVDGGTIKLDGNYPVGTGNVALGDTALDSVASDGLYNTAIGNAAATSVTTGDGNTGVGYKAANKTTSATDNTALGFLSLENTITSSSNTAIGSRALQSNVTGAGNSSIGYYSGFSLGDEIVATAIVSGVNYTIQTLGTTDFTLIGASSNTVGSTFTATGAGTGTGTASANANYNTLVGNSAGNLIVGGSKNSILGRFDGNQNTIDIRNSDNNIVLSDGDGNPRLAYVSANAELVINEQSANVDFRVESDSNANAFFVEGSTDHVGMGVLPTTSYGNVLQIHDTGTAGANLRLTDATSGSGTNNGMEIIQIGVESFVINREAGALSFFTNQFKRMQIESDGSVVINDISADADFRVESDTSTHALFVDAGKDVVTIGNSAPETWYGGYDVLQIGLTGSFASNETSGDTDVLQIMENVYLSTGSTWKFMEGSTGATRLQMQGQDIQFFMADDAGAADAAVTWQSRMRIDTGGTTFNEGSNDLDFRVESDGNEHMLFVDASENAVKIGGTTTREGQLQVFTNASGVAMEIESTSGSSSQGPILQLRRTSASPAGNDYLGALNFVGQDSGDNALSYVDMYTRATTVTDGSEESQFTIRTRRNGTLEERFTLNAVETSINEVGADVDFRVESDSNTNAFIVDASQDNVGIGGTPNVNTKLDVYQPVTSNQWTGRIVSRSDVATTWLGTYTTGSYSTNGLYSHNAALTGWADLYINAHSDVSGNPVSGGTSQTIHSVGTWSHAGHAVFNEYGADYDFRVESDDNTHMLFVDANTNAVGIATSGPSSSCALTVGGSAGDGSPPLFVDSTIAAASTFNYVFQGHVTDLPSSKRAALSVGKAHSAYNQTIMGHYNTSDGSTSNYGFLGMHNADDAIIWDGSKQVGIGTVPSLGARLESEYLGFNTIGNDNWKKGALALTGSFGGGLSFINDGGASDGFAFFCTGSPSTLNLRFGANGGTMSAGVQLSSTATSWAAYSDSRLKTIMSEISGAVEAVDSLRAVKYTLNEDTEATPRVGLIAQEVQAVLPEAVDVIDDDGHLGLRYTEVIPLLVAAIKEQKTTIDDLETRLAALENA